MILFFDTETTGFIKKNAPDSEQPHIVQLAAILTDDNGKDVSCANYTIEPDGYEIPEDSTKIHGITTERARLVGVPLGLVVALFMTMAAKARRAVAHNIDFDVSVLGIEARRCGVDLSLPEKYCTMVNTRDIVKIPPTDRMIAAGFTSYKVPKLIESYTHFFGKGFEGAHDAFADVRACRDVYFKINGGAHDCL